MPLLQVPEEDWDHLKEQLNKTISNFCFIKNFYLG
jgi:hypothetical protein